MATDKVSCVVVGVSYNIFLDYISSFSSLSYKWTSAVTCGSFQVWVGFGFNYLKVGQAAGNCHAHLTINNALTYKRIDYFRFPYEFDCKNRIELCETFTPMNI